MALVIRLRKLGARHKPFFRIAVTEAATARDGRFIEEIGWYDPKKEGLNSKVNIERAQHWLSNGAKPSETVRTILKRHGLLGGKPVTAEEATKPVAEAAIEPEAVPPEPETEVAPEEAPPQAEAEQPEEAPPPEEPKQDAEPEPEQPPAETDQPPAETDQPPAETDQPPAEVEPPKE
jgi:small subunit ribosomal protein S16